MDPAVPVQSLSKGCPAPVRGQAVARASGYFWRPPSNASPLTLYTALQCVPMPIGRLAAVAPHNADVWSRALSPLHEPGPSWAPIVQSVGREALGAASLR